MKNKDLQTNLQNPNMKEYRLCQRAWSWWCWLSYIQCFDILQGRRQKPSALAITLTLAPGASCTDSPPLRCKYFHMSRPITTTPHIFCVITPREHTVPMPPAANLIWWEGGQGSKKNKKSRWGSAMGCFYSCILSIILLSLPSSHVYCISLVLIFADKFLLSCCAASYHLCGHYAKARLDLPYKWTPPSSTMPVCLFNSV